MSFLEIQTQTGWGRTLQGFAEWCRPQPGWLTVDIGCGPGLLPACFAQAGCEAYGIDLDPAALNSDRLHPALVQANALDLPFPDGAFHLVTASNLLFLLENPPRALCELQRILRRNGMLALLNPSERMSVSAALTLADERKLQGLARQSLLSWAQLAEDHHRWSEAEIDEMLSAAGMQIRETTLRVGSGLARFVKALRL